MRKLRCGSLAFLRFSALPLILRWHAGCCLGLVCHEKNATAEPAAFSGHRTSASVCISTALVRRHWCRTFGGNASKVKTYIIISTGVVAAALLGFVLIY